MGITNEISNTRTNGVANVKGTANASGSSNHKSTANAKNSINNMYITNKENATDDRDALNYKNNAQANDNTPDFCESRCFLLELAPEIRSRIYGHAINDTALYNIIQANGPT